MISLQDLLTIFGLLIVLGGSLFAMQRYLLGQLSTLKDVHQLAIAAQRIELQSKIDTLEGDFAAYKVKVAEDYVTDERLVRTEHALLASINEVSRKVDKLTEALLAGGRKRIS